jgi:hypothetical protein
MADTKGGTREKYAIPGMSCSVWLFFHKRPTRFFGPGERPYPFSEQNLEADEFIPGKQQFAVQNC